MQVKLLMRLQKKRSFSYHCLNYKMYFNWLTRYNRPDYSKEDKGENAKLLFFPLLMFFVVKLFLILVYN